MLCNLSLYFRKRLIGSEGFNRVGNIFDDGDKLGGFGRRDPGKLQAVGFDSHVFHQIFKQGKFAAGVVITFQVMAFTGMSPGDPDAVCTFPQGGQKEFGTHPAGARYPDNPDIGRILHSADTGKIGSPIAAPVAQKSHNFWFPIGHIKKSPFPGCWMLVSGCWIIQSQE
jgi:hypothetical protein